MAQTRFDGSFAPIAVATRSNLDETLHHGAGVALAADGSIVASVGDADLVVYPRSALKPLQADALVGLGLTLPPDLLAVLCASHSGERVHLDAVRKILALHDLTEADLQNTSGRPYGAVARTAARSAGIEPSPIQQNCSGKHAGMLATCRINGWSLDSYLEPDHPVQVAITERIAALTGDSDVHVGVDGCGAPTHAVSIIGVARAFSTLTRTGADVALAMMAHPEQVAGSDRDVTTWIRAVPNMIAKEGAAGVMAVARSDGRAAVFKIADGSDLARQAVTIEAMRLIGFDDDVVARVATDVCIPVLGHGVVVGELRALNWRT